MWFPGSAKLKITYPTGKKSLKIYIYTFFIINSQLTVTDEEYIYKSE